ncbi:MAG: hypothetical protein OEW52_03520 [Thermoleophilia bacterium]|nr:hypothetical protein [Thermoleophilia bacterium]MDH4339238.1 hypothetical protein [Thermoleophilia bacterium]MDH5280203.1 hypothetical protein [Thermoleophilia bacterium]
MQKQTLAIVLGAIVLFVGVLVGTLAFTNGGSDEPVHTLPGGQIHTGELPSGDTTGDDDGMTMTNDTDTTP